MIRDKGSPIHVSLNSTDDLVEYLKRGDVTELSNAHPERWAYDARSLVVSLMSDCVANAAKNMFAVFRDLIHELSMTD